MNEHIDEHVGEHMSEQTGEQVGEQERANFFGGVNLQESQQLQVESVGESAEVTAEAVEAVEPEATEAKAVEAVEAGEARAVEAETAKVESAEAVQEASVETAVEGEVQPPKPIQVEPRTVRVGVILYHRATESRYEITCTICPGSRNITVDGVPIEELIERNYIAPISPLIEHMRSERIAGYDLDIRVGNLEWCQKIDPLVIAYALSQALINIISSL
ncbi:MAG: hypothetical protein HZRFUVUK_002061 [Candidatus Fervidibacterota bacterium]|jgi:hypothetical protein